LNKSEKKLLSQFQSLPDQAKQSLIDFCDFLSEQHRGYSLEVQTPKNIPRPESESVVLAMRRLSDTYFMLNKDVILHQASDLMSQHVLQGRGAVEVIDDLESLFLKFYNELLEQTPE